ncbi:Hypothetical protein I595_3181 [Croceitalea dokdonensis DOKDO 023]|uniref:Uncharacterized protein n=1 Tax=Croceitalea dokdonensis DOKDO 023 TaxID=1300341 RepID=A0A0P7AS61_9FLAO|nr:Hypothetical protein I595_3181 [Croceitalea dokdonensis DOKDO 023]
MLFVAMINLPYSEQSQEQIDAKRILGRWTQGMPMMMLNLKLNRNQSITISA